MIQKERIKKLLLMMILTLLLSICMGVVSAVFLKLLHLVTSIREEHLFSVVFLPVTGILTAVVYQRFGKHLQRGNNLIIDSVHGQTHVPLRMAIFAFVFTLLSHLTGGSVGREGTAVQISGTIANKIGKVFKLSEKTKSILVMAGISAGFSSVFGMPFAGAFFGMEMCFIGKLSYEALFPCFVASFASNFITSLFGVPHTTYSIQSIPSVTLYRILIIILASVIFGLVGRLFATSVHRLKEFYTRLIKRPVWRAFIGSLIVLGVMVVFHAVEYGGLSTWMIGAGFEGKVGIFDPLLKFIMTVLTLGAGFQGGEVTPLFDIGASLGGLIGQISHVEPSLLAALGFIAVFGCAANTPLTTIILGIELFGVGGTWYYILAALISYYISGNNGIYTAQVIHVSKYHRQEDVGETLQNIGNKR